MYEYKSEKKGKKEKNMAGSLSLVINGLNQMEKDIG